MRIIEPLGNEEEILREAAVNSPQSTSDEQAAPVAVSIEVSQPDTPPLAPTPIAAPPSPPMRRKRNNWLFILAVVTILANSSSVMLLLAVPSDTHMMFAGRPLFALPIEGDPKALSHPVDYLTMGLTLAQIILACFIFKFRWARIAIAYVAIVVLCLSIRALVLSASLPYGGELLMMLSPLGVIFAALFGGINIIPELLASFIIPVVLIITTGVLSLHDWRQSRNSSEFVKTLRSEPSE